jgi:hypothetical protein
MVIHAEVSGTDAMEDVFFCLDSRSSGFDGSGLHQSKRLAIEGLLLGGFRIKPCVRQIVRTFQLVKYDSKGPAAKSQEPLSPFSFFRIHLSTNTFRHQQSNQISPAVQSVKVTVLRLGFPCDETLGANLTHPASYSLGFARGVLSPLTSNAFKFGFGMCFR